MKILQGVVTSLKQDKTATVLVSRKWKHPLYKKVIRRTKKHACHYQDIKLAIGDKVTIQECRPISKTKHFEVVKKMKVEPKKVTKETAKKVASKKIAKKTTKKATK